MANIIYVTDGLTAGDKIVIEGVQNLKDGQSITPITPAEKEAEYQKALKDQKEGNLAKLRSINNFVAH